MMSADMNVMLTVDWAALQTHLVQVVAHVWFRFGQGTWPRFLGDEVPTVCDHAGQLTAYC